MQAHIARDWNTVSMHEQNNESEQGKQFPKFYEFTEYHVDIFHNQGAIFKSTDTF